MGPGRRQYWLPLTRLGAFFVAVVVTGNVVFFSFRPAAADVPFQDQVSESFNKRKLRLKRQLNRTLQKVLGVVPSFSSTESARPGRSPEIVEVVLPAANTLPLQAIAPPPSAPPPRLEVLGFVEPEAAPFLWPEPLAPLVTRFASTPDLPGSLGMMDEVSFRAGLVSEFYRRGAPDPVADFGDALLVGPELLLDGIFTCATGMSGRPTVRSWDEDEGRSITSQLLQVERGPRKERVWNEFLTQLADREQKYFSGFGDSRANSFGFENGTEAADLNDLALDQRKVFWDALRRTYLARYKVQAEEKIKDDAWYFDRWTGADFVVLPPLLGAYVYYRGLDKKFNIGPSRMTVSIEPVSEWVRRSHDISAVASMEWAMKGWPLGVIVSAGLHDGRYGLDFIGVGTSIGTVRQLLEEETNLANRR
jgi:hypothetical protein